MVWGGGVNEVNGSKNGKEKSEWVESSVTKFMQENRYWDAKIKYCQVG